MRKRIAVLVAQIDETTQKRFLTEFIREAYAYDYDVCIFTMYQKYQETILRGEGDANIFELVNYTLFDAVIVLLDTIQTPGLAMPLQERIKENFSGPVLVVDQESPYFSSIMMDHYTPVRKLVDHLIEVHGYQEIAFLGGRKGHPHSVQRLNGFTDSMKAHGLEIKDEWVYHGNYWYDSAELFVDQLLKDRDHLPRALACANDCMAIGAAAKLTESGLRVPEDIAVIGYDSLEDGRSAPQPLTSASIPADECGGYCLRWLDAMINGKEKPAFEPKAPLFIGASCGCKYEIELVPKKLRSIWRTQQSARSIFSDFNHIVEDLLTQTDLKGFLEKVDEYSYQIEPYYSFDICMNDAFLRPECNIGEKALRKGYSDTVYRVLSSTKADTEREVIGFKRCFSTKELIPELTQERDYPTTFIFNPLYFDDRSFGYIVLNNKDEVYIYDERFRIWMRNVMQGMEAMYRQQYLQMLVDQIKADQVRDSLTGLYNYDGFIRQAMLLAEQQQAAGKQMNVISVDIKGIKTINEIYGRDYGMKAISAIARIVQQVVGEDEICCRMCDDEFLIALLDSGEQERAKDIVRQIKEEAKQYRLLESSEYILEIYYAILAGNPTEERAVEALINHAISIKDHKKVAANQGDESKTKELEEEIKRNQLVTRILNQNLLTYYYQPIINVQDGSVYAYEALMRYEKEKISPFQIIQAAVYLRRLPDIERATLLNVSADVEEHMDKFGNAKVFMNSLPGIQLSDEDDETFARRMRKDRGRFVIEFTEESELDDAQLAQLKEKYGNLGNEIALDDYGAGYSNVNNLLRYMPQYVKIDRQLVTQIEENPQKQHFVRSIIEFAHNNDIVALAEGVETKEELQTCIKLGTDLIQGYYTGRPGREPIGAISEELQEEIRMFYRQSMDWQSRYSMQ